ncbi:MAG TPA: amino acid racemase [Bacteroidales bacterium]|nr:amino acid racemase [Bacteroidales bacterium]
MKTIGIIGGLGPEATVDYYNLLIDSFKDDSGSLNYPEIIIYSVNMSEFLGLMREKKYDSAARKVADKAEALKRAGADFAAITANTPHMLFDQITGLSPLPLISIVEATCEECMKMGVKRAGLMGTGFTMNATFYQDVFKKHGLEVLVPEASDRELINHKLFTEIELGIFRDETRQILVGIIEKMVSEQKIDSIILGCTELPLILKEPSYSGIPALNTTKIHVDAIVKYCVESKA